ncbi:HAD-IA family hydrolase [bacterium]|nr:HAD-IA family hydrolase [bacterium]
MRKRAVIFDLDGTLVDAFQDIANAINRPLAARGMPTHSVDTIRTFVGEGAGKLIERSVPPGTDAATLESVRAEMMAWYRDHPADHAFIYEGILPVLEALRSRGVPMGVLSNKPHAMTLSTCERLGLSDFFGDVAGEQGAGVPRKPDPMGLRLQLERLGVEDAIMVGDGRPDGEVARAAGVPFVAVTWGTRTAEQLLEYGPVAVVDHPSGLPEPLALLLAKG